MISNSPIEIIARSLFRATLDLPGRQIDRNAYHRIKDPSIPEVWETEHLDISEIKFITCTEMFGSTALGFDLHPRVAGAAMTESITMLTWSYSNSIYNLYWNARLAYTIDARFASKDTMQRLKASIAEGRSWSQHWANMEFSKEAITFP